MGGPGARKRDEKGIRALSGLAEPNSLRHYLQMVLRRKWTILLPTILVPAVLVGLSLRQEKLYQATAQVVVNQQDVANQILTGVGGTGGDPERDLQTQAAVARSPAVTAKALANASVRGRTRSPARASVGVVPGADLLQFQVADPDPAYASRLTTAYARAYTRYRSQAVKAAVEAARQDTLRQLSFFQTPEDRRSAAYADLVNREQQLRLVPSLEASNSYVLQPSSGAIQIQPRPAHRGLIGLVLGLALGLCLALLWEALDTRVQTAEEVAERLHLPLLARIPAMPPRLRGPQRLVMLSALSSTAAEAFRILATNLDFVKLDRTIRSVVVTSGTFAEGRSTVAANLGVTLARSGQHVAIVDLDLRNPTDHSLFGILSAPGVTDVALNRVDLDDAMVTVAIGEGKDRGDDERGDSSSNGKGAFGRLELLSSGPIPPNPGEFITSQPLRQLLDRLRNRVDVVVIDAPPMITVADAISLSAWADAVLVVSRLGVARRPLLSELRQVLDACPAYKLGVVVTGVEGAEGVVTQAQPVHPARSRKVRREALPRVWGS